MLNSAVYFRASEALRRLKTTTITLPIRGLDNEGEPHGCQ